MIKIDPKPHKTVESFRGTIELDKEYGFVVEKTSKQPPVSDPKESPYYVERVYIVGYEETPDEDIKQDVISLIEETVKNYCKKNGIGKSES